jgi:hypothetical protein
LAALGIGQPQSGEQYSQNPIELMSDGGCGDINTGDVLTFTATNVVAK